MVPWTGQPRPCYRWFDVRFEDSQEASKVSQFYLQVGYSGINSIRRPVHSNFPISLPLASQLWPLNQTAARASNISMTCVRVVILLDVGSVHHSIPNRTDLNPLNLETPRPPFPRPPPIFIRLFSNSNLSCAFWCGPQMKTSLLQHVTTFIKSAGMGRRHLEGWRSRHLVGPGHLIAFRKETWVHSQHLNNPVNFNVCPMTLYAPWIHIVVPLNRDERPVPAHWTGLAGNLFLVIIPLGVGWGCVALIVGSDPKKKSAQALITVE